MDDLRAAHSGVRPRDVPSCSRGLPQPRDLVVITSGEPVGKSGGTNTLKIVRAGESRD
jgi:pyruvate kinase